MLGLNNFWRALMTQWQWTQDSILAMTVSALNYFDACAFRTLIFLQSAFRDLNHFF